MEKEFTRRSLEEASLAREWSSSNIVMFSVPNAAIYIMLYDRCVNITEIMFKDHDCCMRVCMYVRWICTQRYIVKVIHIYITHDDAN